VFKDSRRFGILVNLLIRVSPNQHLVLVGWLPKDDEPIRTGPAGPIGLKEGRLSGVLNVERKCTRSACTAKAGARTMLPPTAARTM